jgi:hypothetical protein
MNGVFERLWNTPMNLRQSKNVVNSNPDVNTQFAACETYPSELENAKHRELVANNGVTTIKSPTL